MTRLCPALSILRFIYSFALIFTMLFSANVMFAKKPPVGVCGRIYLSSGDSIVAEGETRIGVPVKTKKLEIVERAYTKSSKVGRKISPDSVETVVLWVPSAPGRTHTFSFIKDYGWCWQLERGPHIAVYCFASHGYHFAGNGGLWTRGKGTLVVCKDGKTYNFGRPDKKMSDKVRREIEQIIADDAELCAYIRQARGRRDKVVRSLCTYQPNRQ